MNKLPAFQSGLCYHEVLKANTGLILFRDDSDRRIFVRKMCQFILPCCEVLAYAILGNHVHLIIRPHPEQILSRLTLELRKIDLNLTAQVLPDYLDPGKKLELPDFLKPYRGPVHHQIRYAIRSLKLSYDYDLARKHELTGTLWLRRLSSTLLETTDDLIRTILYIHKNPVYHGMVHNPEDWQYSSFNEIVEGKDWLVRSEEILGLFGSLQNFLQAHEVVPGEFGKKPAR